MSKANLEITSPEKTRMTPEESAKAKEEVKKAAGKSIKKVLDFFDDPSLEEKLRTWQIIVADTKWDKAHFCGNWELKLKEPSKEKIVIFGPKLLTGQCRADIALPSVMIERIFQNLPKHSEDAPVIPDYIRRGLIVFFLGIHEKMLIRELNTSYPIFDMDQMFSSKGRLKSIRWAMFGYCFDEIYGSQKLKKLVRQIYKGDFWESAIEDITGKSFDEINEDCDECMMEKIKEITKSSKQDYEAVFDAFRQKDFKKVIELGEAFLKNHPDSPFQLHCTFDLGIANFKMQRYQVARQLLEKVRTGAIGPSYIYDDSANAIVYMLLQQKSCDEAKKTYEKFLRYYAGPSFRVAKQWDTLYKEACTPREE